MGKKLGKTLLGIAGFAFGFANPAAFGLKAGAHLAAGLYGASVGSYIWNSFNPPKVESASRFDRTGSYTTSEGVIPVIYGTRAWGGNVTYNKVSDDGKTLTMHVVLCEGEIEGVLGVRVNGMLIKAEEVFKIRYDGTAEIARYSITKNKFKLRSYDVDDFGRELNSKTVEFDLTDKSIKELYDWINTQEGWSASNLWVDVTPKDLAEKKESDDVKGRTLSVISQGLEGCSYQFFNGSPNQTPPSTWETTGGYKNCSYLIATLKLSDKVNGNPSISCIVKGKKVQVWRDGAWHKEYSENPAFCIRDLLLSKRYGLGQIIKPDMIIEETFREAADYCDYEVEYKDAKDNIQREKRYRLNIILDQAKDAISHLADMLINFGGFLTFPNNQVSLRVEKQTNISYAFDDDTIVQGTMEVTQTPYDETPNLYRVGYYEPSQAWKMVRPKIEDTVDIIERGYTLDHDLNFPGTISQSQALRLGKFIEKLNRHCSIVISFGVSTNAMHLEAGDIVNVSWNNTFQNMPFRILEIREVGNGTYVIKARQYNESIYNDSLDAVIELKNYAIAISPLLDQVPTVSSIELEQVYYVQRNGVPVSYITGKCTMPSYQFFRRLNIAYSNDNGVTWQNGNSSMELNFTIPNAILEKQYIVKVWVENISGRLSEAEVSDPITITGKNVPPSNVQDLSCLPVQGGFLLTWAPSLDPDIDGYNVYQGTDQATMDASTLIAEKQYATNIFAPVNEPGNYVFHVIAIDTSGNKSKIPATIEANFEIPPDVHGFDVVRNGANLEFRWQPLAQTGLRYEIRRGAVWELGEVIGRTANPFYSLLFPVPGEHVFWIKAYDQYRNYSVNPMFSTTQISPVNDRNQVLTINQVTNGWQGTKINMHVNDGGLQLNENAIRGEYVAKIELPKSVLARNWVNSNMVAVGREMSWGSSNFSWDSPEAKTPWLPDGNISGATVKHQISTFKGVPQNVIEAFELDEHLNGINSTPATENHKVTYADGRFKKGAKITDVTKIAWNVNISANYSLSFYIHVAEQIVDNVVFMVFFGATGKLRIGYDINKQLFYLQDNLGRRNEIEVAFRLNDFVKLGIVQTATTRKLMGYSFSTGMSNVSQKNYSPIGTITKIYGYAKPLS